MRLRLGLVSLLTVLALLAPVPSAAQSPDEKKVLASFKSYITKHFASYKLNRRERESKHYYRDQGAEGLALGWAKEYYEPEPEYSINVERTSSLVSPYVASLDFVLRTHLTAVHKTREEAVADSNFVKRVSVKHRHTYAYQDGKWLPKVRKHQYSSDAMEVMEDKWWDCEEVNARKKGILDIHGCLEEYDNPAPGEVKPNEEKRQEDH